MRKRKGIEKDKSFKSCFFLEFTLNLLDTLKLERAACNNCKLLKLIKILRANGCFLVSSIFLKRKKLMNLRNLGQET